MSIINDFYRATSKDFSMECKVKGVLQDITGDTITLRMKINIDDPDTEAVLTKTADVITEGANGIAIFNLDTTDTDIEEGGYYIGIIWLTAGGKTYPPYQATITVKEKVSDS